MAVKDGKLRSDLVKWWEAVDLPQEMIGDDVILDPEPVEELLLRLPPPHHLVALPALQSK
jgi:hypothetical protein